MKTKRKSNFYFIWLLTISVLLTVNVVALIVSLIWNTPVRRIEKRWGIKLPEGIKAVYYRDDIGWFGEGERYTVLETKQRVIPFLNGESFPPEFIKNSVEHTISLMEIPLKYLPVWEREFEGVIIGNTLDTHISFVNFPNENLLIVCEEFF